MEHQKSLGLMQLFPIPYWKWDNISMYFVSCFPRTMNGCDTIWVIVDGLTKSTHFLPMRLNYPLEKLAEMYIEKISSMHGLPSSIVSDKDLRFTCRLWERLQKAFDTKLRLSSAYHPHTDGQTERIIQSL